MTLSSDEVERLMTYVHQSNLPMAVAARLEEIARTCLWLVFALQETKITLKRLRRLLFGQPVRPCQGRRTRQSRVKRVAMRRRPLAASQPMRSAAR